MALEEGRFFRGSMTDKRFEADGMAEYCRRFLSSGVWDTGTNLQVSAAGGMSIIVGYGSALVDGYPYQVSDNGAGLMALTAANAHATLPRIDRVVVRKDPSAQRIYAYIKQGTPAASPAAPALERTNTAFEISLARIAVAAGAGSISSGNITDERADYSLCGIVVLKKYQVGDYYWSDDSTSPALKFGGTWTRVKDVFILAAGDTYAAGATGGAATKSLTAAQLPSHRLGIDAGIKTAAWSSPYFVLSYQYQSDAAIKFYTDYIGGGEAISIMPPYNAAYCWRRTA